jgi:phage terminase large subunit-like protein
MINESDADQLATNLLKQFVFYEPTPKQQAFHKAGLKASERLFLGGNRTGKTNAVCMEMAMHLTGNYPDWWMGYRFQRPINAISASLTLKDTRDILQKKLFVGDIDGSMPAILHESYVLEKTHTTIAGAWDTVKIRHVSGGVSELKFKAFQQGESSFQGVKADFIHLDELPNFKVYQEALIRTTSFDHEKTFLVCSMWPEKGKDDLISHFLDHASEGEIKDDRFYIMASWADNPHLTPQERQRLHHSTPAWIRDAREHGIPVFGVGKVFTMKEDTLLVPAFEIPPHFALIYGLDPAATSGGTYGAVLLAYDRDKDIVYVVKDYKKNNITPVEHHNNLMHIIPDWVIGAVDPAGGGEDQHNRESTLDFFRRMKRKFVIADKTKGSKEGTIDAIEMRCRSGKFFIFETCTDYLNEWRRYARDEDGKIIKKNDHCLDASFYALKKLKHAKTESQSKSAYQVRRMPQREPGFM